MNKSIAEIKSYNVGAVDDGEKKKPSSNEVSDVYVIFDSVSILICLHSI